MRLYNTVHVERQGTPTGTPAHQYLLGKRSQNGLAFLIPQKGVSPVLVKTCIPEHNRTTRG